MWRVVEMFKTSAHGHIPSARLGCIKQMAQVRLGVPALHPLRVSTITWIVDRLNADLNLGTAFRRVS